VLAPDYLDGQLPRMAHFPQCLFRHRAARKGQFRSHLEAKRRGRGDRSGRWYVEALGDSLYNTVVPARNGSRIDLNRLRLRINRWFGRLFRRQINRFANKLEEGRHARSAPLGAAFRVLAGQVADIQVRNHGDPCPGTNGNGDRHSGDPFE
jgi:hypothetical protein